MTDRAFVQTLPFHPGQKERRRPQREELDLTQRFAVGLLFHDRAELQRLRSSTEKSVGDVVAAKRALVTGHLQGLSHGDLSPARVLEACHHVFEAGCTHGGERLVAHLAANLPEVLTFHGVPLSPSDVFAVRNVLESGGTEGRRFSLDLEDSGIQIPGLRALVGLNNISTYRYHDSQPQKFHRTNWGSQCFANSPFHQFPADVSVSNRGCLLGRASLMSSPYGSSWSRVAKTSSCERLCPNSRPTL